jgi:glycerophosphoryl diester phosphodiesterase
MTEAKPRPSVEWIRRKPIAHRGLHDKAAGRLENSLSAVSAAIEHGYAIEVDLHPSSDMVPMVFHDNMLDRLTSEKGPFRARSARELRSVRLGKTGDHVPTLSELLERVDGKVGLVLELKGIFGEDEGFAAAVLKTLSQYKGDVAIMSFNHWLLADARLLGCNVPLGLTAEGKDKLNALHEQAAKDFEIDFVSYGIGDLPNRFVESFRTGGKPVITWTIRTPEQVEFSSLHADQITFEGFLP